MTDKSDNERIAALMNRPEAQAQLERIRKMQDEGVFPKPSTFEALDPREDHPEAPVQNYSPGFQAKFKKFIEETMPDREVLELQEPSPIVRTIVPGLG